MRTWAFCAASMRERVRRAAGVHPKTCPPVNASMITPACLEGYDLLYFQLHGLPEQPFWYGDGYETALSAETIRKANLERSVAFVANCYLPDSPMLDALLGAGAQAVIGGAGRNFSRKSELDFADLLGLWVRRGLQAGMGPQLALEVAKLRMRMQRKSAQREDTLEFRVWTPAGKKHYVS